MKRSLATAAAAALFVTVPAHAHFQLIYTPEVNLDRPTDLSLLLTFWHPMENGHVMDMGEPQAFFYVHQGERRDLLDLLEPTMFQGAHNEGAAYSAEVDVRRNGDYVFSLVPEPYYEGNEDMYIQQITKVFVNRGGLPSDWSEPVGLPTEIVPLNKPTNLLVNSTFSGVVLSDGEPVPGAEIEIEYLAAVPDLETDAAGEATVSEAPGGTLVAIADSDGVFTFGIPLAGFWGFAALGSGPETTHDGKDLSQDAVIWVRAFDLE